MRLVSLRSAILSHRFLNPWLVRSLHLALLLAAFAFLVHNADAQSPTMDEQNHMARGYALLRTGDPRLSIEHPPLINLLEASLLGRGVVLPLDDPSWDSENWYAFADLFLWHANSLPQRMVFLARLPVIALTLLLGALAARWARELGGRGAALLAPTLILLDPNILAHGSLATTDLGITFTALVAAYALWRFTRHPNLFAGIGLGLALGAMLASKMSALVLWGSYGLLFALGVAGQADESGAVRRRVEYAIRRAFLYLGATVLGLIVVWATYAFQLAPAVEGGIAVPLGTYWSGLGAIFRNVQGGRPSYLLGETRLGGWAVYFPVAFAAKTPLPVLLLLILASLAPVRQGTRQGGLFLLLPVTVYGMSTLASDLNLGYRHLLPLLPPLYIWGAQRLGRVNSEGWRIYAMALSVWLAVETIMIAPHFLAYFNQVAGGPEQGWRILADSNIDWGQDLRRLGAYLDEYAPGETVRLSWFGTAYPERYGIDYVPLPGVPHHFDLWFQLPTFDEDRPEPGLYVISVSNLVELYLMDKHFYTYFRAREPVARIGYSVYIYRVDGD